MVQSNALRALTVTTLVSLTAATPGGHGALVARWSFDQKRATDNITNDAADLPTTLINDSGEAGIITTGEKHSFSIPGSHPRDSLTLGQGALFDLPRAFSLEAWFRPLPAAPGSYVMIIGKRYSNQYQLTWTSNGDGTIEFYVGGGDLVAHRNWASHVPTGHWLHIVAAYDAGVAEGPNQWLYLNGECVHETRNEVVLPHDQEALRIGQNTLLNLPGGVPAAWKEVAIYDQALTAAEVGAAYQAKAPKGRIPPGTMWSVPLTGSAWQKAPGSAETTARRDGMTGILQRPGTAQPGQQAVVTSAAGCAFLLNGMPPDSMSASWRLDLPEIVDASGFGFALLRYRAQGLERSSTPMALVRLAGQDGWTDLLTSSHTVLDGRVHRCLVQVAGKAAVDSIDVEFKTRGSNARFDLLEVTLLRDPNDPLLEAPKAPDDTPDTMRMLQLPPGPKRGFQDIITEILAGKGAAVHEPLTLPKAGVVQLGGTPFQVADGGSTGWPEDTSVAANKEPVAIFGTTVERASFLPRSRDDQMVVPVAENVSEVYLLLVAGCPALRACYNRPTIPYTVTDVEALVVDLVYEDGETETAFPYSVRDQGYRVLGLAGNYVIPADRQRRLRRLILHNRIRGATVGLAAITVNRAAPRFPALAEEPPQPPTPPRPIPAEILPPRALLSDTEAQLQTSAGTLILDWSGGFSIREIRPVGLAAAIHLAPTSGLEVVCNGRVLTGSDWTVESARIEPDATIRLKLKSRVPEILLRAMVVVQAEAEGGILWRLALTNEGPEELRPDIRFPVLRELAIGSAQDTWVFFPQYRNVLTADPVFCEQANHRGFLMQFMDIFGPKSGTGVCLMSRNLTQQPLQYTLVKTENGVTAAIENEGEDFPLPGGQTVTYCDRVLLSHAGDWRQAAEAYRHWVDTWYSPVESQNKPWFRRAPWIRSHLTSPTDARRIGHMPPIYDREAKHWRFDEYLAADEALFGVKPDIIHFYVWAFDGALGDDVARDGEYGGRDYENLGGLSSFHDAIRDLREARGLPVSLYTIWDRFNRDTPFYDRFQDRFAAQRATGERQVAEHKVYISQGVPEWRDYAQQTLHRLQLETQADILYLDVFGTDDRARCFNEDAGHAHVPTWVAEDDREFLDALRQALPDEVVLWGEFPVPDVASQYWDGFLSYDCIPLHSYMAEALDQLEIAPQWSDGTFPLNVFRFAFPHLRQIVFPVGTEGDISNWRYLKFLLFNGQGLFDTTWRLYDDACRQNLGRVLRLQKTYADCFDSLTPETLVQTSRDRVFANGFPGEKRTLWTLFNGRYHSVKGEILRLPHQPGCRYRDVWNDQDLNPRIDRGKAVIEVPIPPQGVGCILQTTP